MWQLSLSQRLRLLERRTEELNAWRDAQRFALRHWTIQQPGFVPRAVKLGEDWGFSDGENGYNTHQQGAVRLHTRILVPSEFAGRALELELDLGGEGLVEVRDASGSCLHRAGLNVFHSAFGLLERAAGGEVFEVNAEVVPKGLFGQRNDRPSLKMAALVAPEAAVRGLVTDLEMLTQSCRALGAHEAVGLLIAAAEQTLSGLPWPSSVAAYHARLPKLIDGAGLWSFPTDLPAARPLEAHWLEGLERARSRLAAQLQKIRGLYPPQGSLALTGHAHIDLAWLWPHSETRRKIRRTFASVLELMRRDPEFHFNQSSAQVYAWLEQDDPELFEQVRERIREGRWEAIGGMWVEPDGQMPSGESWARQVLYGQRYFEQKLGGRSSVAWLPDSFGFQPQLPQVLRSAGIEYFFTTKLRWNETTPFPHDLFEWRGLDGSSVLAHCFWNSPDNYNAVIQPQSLLETWRNFQGKTNPGWLTTTAAPQSLLSFGYGDGGGGPSREMLENYRRLKEYPALPRLCMTRVDEFYARLPQTDLPVWDGELYLELHRGTLTTQGRTKKLHRDLETRLCEAEAVQALAWARGGTYPSALEELWKTLLLHEFHDILPGSSIREVYQDAEADLAAALERATQWRDAALEQLDWPAAPPEPSASPQVTGEGFRLENAWVRVQIGADGWVHSLYDLERQREVLSGPVSLSASRDVPRDWEAWDVNPPQGQMIEGQVSIEALADSLRVTRRWRDSELVQTYQLRERRLEVTSDIDWQERRVWLRADVPLRLCATEASFENAFGSVSRPTHQNAPQDAARFEVSAHRWADLSEPDYGLALLNDGKYGHSATRDGLHLSLLRGTLWPDPSADLGRHHFRYALYPHSGTPVEAGVAFEALRFASPLLAQLQARLELQGVPLLLSALKKSEDDEALVLRLFEPSGRRGRSRLHWPQLGRAARCDLLEHSDVPLETQGDQLSLELRPFEVVTLKLWPR